tara:strand:- start:1872 stop:3008 length:1137 start_codon:yes stop_codon:yes gene_type:complete
LFDYPKGRAEGVSIIVPCFNAEKTIGSAIESLLDLDYPKDMIEIIVVDDKSSDQSRRIVEKYVAKYGNIRLIENSRNSGGAAEPTNLGIKAAKYDYVAVTDDDSMPERDALIKMIGFLQKDEKVAAVTCAVMAAKPEKFIQKLQKIEYAIISWGRKLLDKVGAVYVTPGPFTLYRKKSLIEVGLFDTKNMTQDIEIVWRLMYHGYKAKMCLDARVISETPKKFGAWWRQRVRWNIGGTQCIIKYKKFVFRKGMLGAFIIPFFSFSLFMGLFGLGIFVYLLVRQFIVRYLSTKYSIYAGSTILRFQEINFNPTVLNFFGIALFFIGLAFTLVGLTIMREPKFKNKNILNILFYMLIYLAVYPFIMVNGLYRVVTKKYSW